MCYSSQILAEWKKYRRNYGVEISGRRGQGEKIKMPKALEDGFLEPENDAEKQFIYSVHAGYVALSESKPYFATVWPTAQRQWVLNTMRDSEARWCAIPRPDTSVPR